MILKVENIMTREVVSVKPEALLDEVVKTLTEHGFNGVPVVDAKKRLVGIITEYDLVTKGSNLHIPTISRILDNVVVLKQDSGQLKQAFQSIRNLTAKDIMNDDPLTIDAQDSVENAMRVFAEHHRVNPILVTDKEKRLVGVLSRYDIIKLYSPDALAESVKKIDVSLQNNPGEVEQDVSEVLKSLNQSFVMVSKWRSRYWYVIGAILFVLGFVTSILWIVNISVK